MSHRLARVARVTYRRPREELVIGFERPRFQTEFANPRRTTIYGPKLLTAAAATPC